MVTEDRTGKDPKTWPDGRSESLLAERRFVGETESVIGGRLLRRLASAAPIEGRRRGSMAEGCCEGWRRLLPPNEEVVYYLLDKRGIFRLIQERQGTCKVTSMLKSECVHFKS
ncbi:hypothetical protein PIB30_065057 [Stylosanthes scabra]|uniref:Uncharacterized protein n=1 Tax=Stylosanthes scabra TaxID=79078 RepID=A0ABU6VL59_9FABA|nr:hypothetical protein [Stylosanthes scabra]